MAGRRALRTGRVALFPSNPANRFLSLARSPRSCLRRRTVCPCSAYMRPRACLAGAKTRIFSTEAMRENLLEITTEGFGQCEYRAGAALECRVKWM